MKHFVAYGAALLLLGGILIGCGKPETGEKGNPPPNVPQAGGLEANKGKGAPAVVPTTTADFSSDAKITETAVPGVQKALTDETALQGAENSITVEVKDKKIFLKGTAKDNAAKKKAGEVAQAALKTMNAPADVTINNSLMVKNR
jgi:hypothetical protein